ncbi:hypothetical protein HYC85_016526 [Camellia sinensis]|uniref:Glycosyl transferase CAP10 domain-containing protein n=1 Tax=Camellia sinensis TaxID=4442 RepID=A0A7J7H3L7_CAMSI|nr:hypothetical protein HYC85_016526 [Camellia sinensis]
MGLDPLDSKGPSMISVLSIVIKPFLEILALIFHFKRQFYPPTSSDIYPDRINCSITCPVHSLATIKSGDSSSSEVCPEYFQWIHQDLNPWKENGITKEMVESAESKAYARIKYTFFKGCVPYYMHLLHIVLVHVT